MENKNIRETIKNKAVEIFSVKGFYGTSIREIAAAADCSLPMLYYYYNNKNDLFEEVAYHEFVRLIERLNSSVILGESVEDLYFQAVKQRKELNSYDKGVFKLSLKVWLGFDGSKAIREKLIEWENSRRVRTREIMTKICSDPTALTIVTDIMNRVIENMTEKIILLNEDISDEEIKEEIEYIIRIVKE